MKKILLGLTLIFSLMAQAQTPKGDIFKTSLGELQVQLVKHGSLMLTLGDKVIQVDPISQSADYSALPKADLILVTHEHGDHFDKAAIYKTKKPSAEMVASAIVAKRLPGAKVLANGESAEWNGVKIDAVPAYNVANKRHDGQVFHPKGDGNGYVLTFGDFKLYIGADTENIEEMKQLKNIDLAFLPKNLPYTMTDEMLVAAAKSFKPKTLYVYHYFELDKIESIKKELEKEGVEVRVFKK
ncbi:MAG: MBL fold metallo-hydrolase [Prevotellaceae bacterium]|jgi:L-ascorbate metabolism protein UlaG (beta-lactamase superfamily)|nr:MBL fold metallo-hydrolase [Prevotellaceae bacterium]